MIAASLATRIFLFEGAVDMRKGFKRLNAAAFDGSPRRIRTAQEQRCASARPSCRCCWTDWNSHMPKGADGGAGMRGSRAKMGPVF
jgi:hypothetical protein